MTRTINLNSAELRAQVSTAQRLYAASKDPALAHQGHSQITRQTSP